VNGAVVQGHSVVMVLYRTTSASSRQVGATVRTHHARDARVRNAAGSADQPPPALPGRDLLWNAPAGGEQRIHFLLRREPILFFEPRCEAAPLRAQIRCLRDHCAACVGRNSDVRSTGRSRNPCRCRRASCGRRLGGRFRGAGAAGTRCLRRTDSCGFPGATRWVGATSGHLKFLLKFNDGELTPPWSVPHTVTERTEERSSRARTRDAVNGAHA
jgi:hypothetical protein